MFCNRIAYTIVSPQRAAVEYVRQKVNALPTKIASKSTKKRFSEGYLDSYFVPTWIRDKQFVALFNYNGGSDFEKRM
jgi:hypothetical protein